MMMDVYFQKMKETLGVMKELAQRYPAGSQSRGR